MTPVGHKLAVRAINPRAAGEKRLASPSVERRWPDFQLIFEKDKGKIIFGDWRIYTVGTWRTKSEKGDQVPRSVINGYAKKNTGDTRDFGTQDTGCDLKRVRSNFHKKLVKPTRNASHLLNIGAKEKDAIVLDFFAGAGSIAPCPPE